MPPRTMWNLQPRPLITVLDLGNGDYEIHVLSPEGLAFF